tara:strand:+ start:1878 stop:3155 length:1278 start_codon:yes stop_codon:yes gene_type:complete
MIENINDIKLAVIGLGYVGLPLSVAFGEKRSLIGFDINNTRIENLKKGLDNTLEVTESEIKNSKGLTFSSNPENLSQANVYIVTVPTPIDSFNCPDLTPLVKASKLIGKYLKPDDIVIYESTVYPGCIEEDCVPILESASGLKFNIDFYAGYSPERINPGDKNNRLTTIKKVTSGSTKHTADIVDQLYKSVITAGTHLAPSIKVAEAAKVIENTQRDINIALINELAMIFEIMEINTKDVLDAASTKWNFLDFRPGLVGGHCIGVDPYYLTHKAQSLGYNPELVLAGRRINDGMGRYVANQIIKEINKSNFEVSSSRVLVLGLTFKENCPDLRNSKVVDVITNLEEHGIAVDSFDPWVSNEDAKNELNIDLTKLVDQKYEAIVFAVAHDELIKNSLLYVEKHGRKNCVVYDLKSILHESLRTSAL